MPGVRILLCGARKLLPSIPMCAPPGRRFPPPDGDSAFPAAGQGQQNASPLLLSRPAPGLPRLPSAGVPRVRLPRRSPSLRLRLISPSASPSLRSTFFRQSVLFLSGLFPALRAPSSVPKHGVFVAVSRLYCRPSTRYSLPPRRIPLQKASFSVVFPFETKFVRLFLMSLKISAFKMPRRGSSCIAYFSCFRLSPTEPSSASS